MSDKDLDEIMMMSDVDIDNKIYETKLLATQATQIKELESEIDHLKELLRYAPVPILTPEIDDDNPVARHSPQMEIIEVEFRRLHDQVVKNNLPLETSDVKKLDILVKCYVSLKNGIKPPKVGKKEKEMGTEELLSIVSGNINGYEER